MALLQQWCQTVFVLFLLHLLMFGIAIAAGQEMVYLSSPLAAMVVSGIIWSIWSNIYYNKYLSSCNSKIIWMKKKGYLKPKVE